jgi:hypothetical protein
MAIPKLLIANSAFKKTGAVTGSNAFTFSTPDIANALDV